MLRDKIYDKLIIKRENFPESYFELQKRVARNRGEQVEEISENAREKMKDVAIKDQRHSLDAWVDYLSSEDAVYPAWFKYYVWKNITKLSQFDKEKGEFKKRTNTTVAQYPDIYREPLAKIADIYEKVKEDNKNLKEPEIQEAFSKKFPNLYADLIQESLALSMEGREEVKGSWVKYEQAKDGEADKLFASLENKGTGWCTAGRSTSETQIEDGDFYVYYSNDKEDNPTQPRLAIRMNGHDKIGEVRGVLPHQNVEPILQDTLNGKLEEFGSEADTYRKKSEDMKQLTEIDKRAKDGEQLNKADLTFLYEIDSSIEGFGYGRDPRIKEIREGRNKEEDMLIIFECIKEQIARSVDEVNENTKVYVGEWNLAIFQTIKQYPNIKHLYESFPEEKIFMQTLGTDPSINSPEKVEQALKEKNIQLSGYGKDILYKTKFSKEGKTYKLVQFTAEQLGFPNGVTTDEILDVENLETLGLELCPAEVGPQLRMQYEGSDWKRIAMKPLVGRDGTPFVWDLSARGAELELNGIHARPDVKWSAVSRFVFLSPL